MKKNDYIIVISAVLFSGLFYGQLAGINFLLFTLLLSAVTVYFNPVKTKDKHWWLYCVCMNVAALSIFVINSDLSVFACLMSILVFSGKSFSPFSSTLVNGVSSVYSILRSPLDLGLNIHRYFNNRQQVPQGHTKKIVFGIIVAIVAAFLFLALYMSANPLFANFFPKHQFFMAQYGMAYIYFFLDFSSCKGFCVINPYHRSYNWINQRAQTSNLPIHRPSLHGRAIQ